jgi:hypothetical protein
MRGLFWFLVGFFVAVLAIDFAWGDEADGRLYQGADGQYHYHDEAWEGIWIAEQFRECCGKSDCHKANTGDGFAVVRLADGSGFQVTIPQVGGELVTFAVPYNESVVKPSQDGNYWVCTRIVGGNGTKVPRCVFTPPLGF